MTQAGVDVNRCDIRHHGIANADLCGMYPGLVITQEAVRCGEDIGQGDEPDELVFFHHRQMMNAIVVHQRARFCQRGGRRHRYQVGAHDGFDAEHVPVLYPPVPALASLSMPGTGTIARNTYLEP